MRRRDMEISAAVDKAQREYIRQAAGASGGAADELEKLGALKEKGVISEEEFLAQKTKLLA